MNFYNILIVISLVGLIYYNGLKQALIFFVVVIIPIGTIAGLVSSGYFYGEVGKYFFLILLVFYGIFLKFKCDKELSKSIEGQGICIKREWKKLVKNIKK